ncbi:type I-E CRISPR-associated protein Cse2/CasB [Atlantibacter subterranea]|uniref:Type I-E CRISPR-associated protein Cse2/CasB n=1 Tax=Atlantibacter subterraneus TaxID=255519 RepID=A0ABU4E6C7_9ENTR|nr:type I-E CRISPR-associated protein Cse2/CasB [Atlantibacter subterranea]MDV7024685.1 type I-E CRISPR-associated protein Cse2/CasB [Atlantibacter subterranea]MDZ5667893.1 type I-E CRISPR-associated protein Cse2/CasB [Atlantibacter hermannii]
MSTTAEPINRNKKFIDHLFKRCQEDKGFAARLRRANNPATEYQSWEVLGAFGVDLEKKHERQAYATVAAALANSRAQRNGSLTLGKAIAMSFPDGNEDKQAIARLRRLLACGSIPETCLVLRPLLSLIQSRVTQALDYEQLLGDLLWFGERTRARWAQQFYARSEQKEDNL